MVVFHITSLQSAINILETGTFHAYSRALLNNDNGLNCFKSGESGNFTQCFKSDEDKDVRAILSFRWKGKIIDTDQDTYPPLKINVLHNQLPWRCFIRVGTDSELIRAANIKIGTLSDDYLPFWGKSLPESLKNKLKRKKKLRLLLKLKKLVNKNESILIN